MTADYVETKQSVIRPRRGVPLAVALMVGVLAYVGLFAAGGELNRLALAGLAVVPFVVLAVLAYGSITRPWARWTTVVGFALLTFGFAGFAFSMTGSALALKGGNQLAGFTALVPALALAVLAGWLGFLPAVRRAAARWLPIDARSFVHATALATVVGCTLISFVPLLIVGEPPLLVLIERQGAESLLGDRSAAGQLLDQIYTVVWLVPAALLAVGWPLARDFGQARRRLGLVRPSARQLGLAFALAAGLVVAAVFGLGGLIDWLFRTLGWPRTDVSSFQQLIAYALNPVGAVVIGVTAGLGEELAVRGVMQPRLGIVLSNLCFTALHAFQYGLDGLLTVFLLGLVLGLIRRATNTTTAAVTHGLYNFSLIMGAVLQLPGFH